MPTSAATKLFSPKATSSMGVPSKSISSPEIVSSEEIIRPSLRNKVASELIFPAAGELPSLV